MEGLIFGGACLRREICVSKSIGLALQLEVNLPFLLCFTLYLRAISKYNPPGGLYLEGLIHGGAYFRNFTVSKKENIYGVNKTPKNPKKRKRYTTISKNVVGRKAKSFSQDRKVIWDF